MIQIFKVFISLFILLTLASCTEDDTYVQQEYHPDNLPMETGGITVQECLNRKTLSILYIGNSYSTDATVMLNNIAIKAGIPMQDICFYRLFRESGSFKSWYDCYHGLDNKDYKCSKVMGLLDADIPTGPFKAKDNTPLREILNKQWDIIILQQSSKYANSYNLWNNIGDGGYLNHFMKLLRSLQPNAVFAFSIIHSYAANYSGNSEKSTSLRWQNITNSVISLQHDYPIFQIIIPYGTAIQNVRNTPYCDNTDMTRDGIHLSRGLACYIAACTVYQSLLYPRYGISIAGNSYRYTCTEDENKLFNGKCTDVTDDNAPIAHKAAIAACENPYSITNLDY